MQTKNYSFRMLIALALLTGTQQVANAQFGGLLNKAKSAAKTAVNGGISKQKDEAKAKVSEKQAAAAQREAPECPWVLQKGVNQADVEALVNNLGNMNNEKTKNFAKQIDDRAEYNKYMLENMKTGGPVPFNSTTFNNASEEKRNWENLFGLILNKGNAKGPTGLRKTDEGWVSEDNSKIIIDTKNGIFVTIKDGKGSFCNLGGDGIYVDEDNIQLANEAFLFNLNAATLLEGFAQYQDKDLERSYNRALIAAKLIGEAIKNNSPSNLETKARPKAGSMNGAWKAKALALAKQKYTNVVDVIIVSSSWDVKKNALGVPINRIIYGYVLTKDKVGTRAMRISWDQKYQGGNYGPLKNYGVAAESPFYVK